MSARLIAGCLLTVLCYAGGREYVGILNARIRKTEAYIRFAEDLASAVAFSRRSVLDYCLAAPSLPGLGTWIRQNPDKALSVVCTSYRAADKTEAACVERLTEAISTAVNSSDADRISRGFLEAAENMKRFLYELKEEYGGKIKIAPRLALAAGAFAAVIML